MSAAGRYDRGPNRKRGSEHLPSLALRACDPCGGRTVSDRAELKSGKELRTFCKIMQINARTWNRRRRCASRCANCTYVAGDAPLPLFAPHVGRAWTSVVKGLKSNDLRSGTSLPRRPALLEKIYDLMPKMFRRKGGGKDTSNRPASDGPDYSRSGQAGWGTRTGYKTRADHRRFLVGHTPSGLPKNRWNSHPCSAEPAGRFCSAQKYGKSFGPKAQPFIQRRAKPW